MSCPKRVLTIFGTRPAAIKLFPLLHTLERDPRFISRICVTGQHRAMLDPVLSISEITPHHDLAVMRPGQTLERLTARLLLKIGAVIEREHPDIVIVQGDTADAFTGALAAYYHRVRIAHVEAGLRSGDIYHPWPEEVNRKAIGTMAALHFAPTQTAAQALVAENIDASTIYVTGNTVIDALQWIGKKVDAAPELVSDLRDLERRFAGRRIVGVTCHRRENLGGGIEAVTRAVSRLAERPDVAIVFPVHLNPGILETVHAELSHRENVALLDPLDYPRFAHLLAMSHLVLTDSGGVQEEAPAFGTPVLVMRETTERPEGIAAGTARLVGTDPDRIVSEVVRLLENEEAYTAMSRAHNPYGDGQAAARIAEVLATN